MIMRSGSILLSRLRLSLLLKKRWTSLAAPQDATCCRRCNSSSSSSFSSFSSSSAGDKKQSLNMERLKELITFKESGSNNNNNNSSSIKRGSGSSGGESRGSRDKSSQAAAMEARLNFQAASSSFAADEGIDEVYDAAADETAIDAIDDATLSVRERWRKQRKEARASDHLYHQSQSNIRDESSDNDDDEGMSVNTNSSNFISNSVDNSNNSSSNSRGDKSSSRPTDSAETISTSSKNMNKKVRNQVFASSRDDNIHMESLMSSDDMLAFIASKPLDDDNLNLLDAIIDYIPALTRLGTRSLEVGIPMIFTFFQEEAHLPYALKLVADTITSKQLGAMHNFYVSALDRSIFRAASLALIRCYSKGGDIQSALQVIDKVRLKDPKSLRHRLYFPILEAIKSTGDVHLVLDLITQSVIYTDETYRAVHITTLLETATKSGSLYDKQIIATLNKFLLVLSKELNPLPFSSLIDINAHLIGTTKEAVIDQGVFIERIENLESELREKSLKILVDERKKGYVIAEDRRVPLEWVMGNTASRNGLTMRGEAFKEIFSQKFSFRKRPTNTTATTTATTTNADTFPTSSSSSSSLDTAAISVTSASSSSYSRPTSNARIVRLYPTGPGECTCPHCSAKLAMAPLEPHERQSIRLSFIKQISAFFQVNFEEFLAFESWLKKSSNSRKRPFQYFLDGCNIGYAHQNHPDGCFSVAQIRSVVDYFKNLGRSVCIILPRSYTLYNSHFDAMNNRVRTYSIEERQQITSWIDEEILFPVPDNIHDDLFCMYATVSASSHPNAAVVTNDLLRNHVYAFETSPIFKKWRENHILEFTFKYERPNSNSNSSSSSSNSNSNSNNSNSSSSVSLPPPIAEYLGSSSSSSSSSRSKHAPLDVKGAEAKGDIPVRHPAAGGGGGSGSKYPFFHPIYQPVSNMQLSNNGYWHIPSLDRNAWLCFKFKGKPALK